MIRWQVDGYEIAFTTRVGGVSEGPYASLNLGRKSGDEVECVDENRRQDSTRGRWRKYFMPDTSGVRGTINAMPHRGRAISAVVL